MNKINTKSITETTTMILAFAFLGVSYVSGFYSVFYKTPNSDLFALMNFGFFVALTVVLFVMNSGPSK